MTYRNFHARHCDECGVHTHLQAHNGRPDYCGNCGASFAEQSELKSVGGGNDA